MGAVSPDGRRIAYWERGLWLLDLSAPAAPRQVLSLADGELVPSSTGGGVAWSTDGTGLLFAVVTNHPPRPDGPPDHSYATSALRQVDLATGDVREILREAPGFPYFPLAWDRTNGRSAAVSWGPGGFAMGYVVVRDDGTRVEPGSSDGRGPDANTGPSAFRVAPGAGHVLVGTFFADDPQGVWVWPFDDRSRTVRFEPHGAEHVVAVLWRSPTEIVVSISTDGDVREGERLDLWSLDGTRRPLTWTKHRLEAVRPDGSAAITSIGLIDLETGTVAPIPGYSGGAVASVVLR